MFGKTVEQHVVVEVDQVSVDKAVAQIELATKRNVDSEKKLRNTKDELEATIERAKKAQSSLETAVSVSNRRMRGQY